LTLSWIVIALLSAAIGSVVSILDKTVLYRYARTPLTLPLIIGISQTGFGVVVLLVVHVPAEATWGAVGVSVASGVIFGLGGQLLMRVLYTQEVSRTIPVLQTAPIFAALIGMMFLDEVLTLVQWVAVLATVLGAALLSVRLDGEYRRIFLSLSFFLLLASAFLMATANVLGKVAVDDLPLMFTHALRMLSLGAVFLVFNVRRAPIADVRFFVTSRSPALLFIAANELFIANTGLVLLLWALSLGPVGLVTALAASRALFVVLYSTGLALVWKGALGEVTTRGAVAVKLSSVVLIVGGVAAIAV
jgi:uncharacterized membrane protein